MITALLLKFIMLNIVVQNKFTVSNYLRSEANLLKVLNAYINERELYLTEAVRYLNVIERSYNNVKDSIYKTCSNNSLSNVWYEYLTYKRVLVDWTIFVRFLSNDTNISDLIAKSIYDNNRGMYADFIMEQNDLKLLRAVQQLTKTIHNATKEKPIADTQNKQHIKDTQLQIKQKMILKLKKLKETVNKFLKDTKVNKNASLTYWANYKELCRGEIMQNQSDNNLKCRYFHNNKPYLYIGPLKLEELHAGLPVYMYHDVLYDKEIEEIQELLKKQNMYISQGTETIYRVSKVTWLHRKAMLKLQRRMELMTNLDMESAENIQVGIYGIAGHYLPHYDTGLAKNAAPYRRLATLLFYMSDTKKGGATVFTNLKLAVWPKKGSAVFWYNLKPDYEVDTRSLHAGCPLYVGTKSVLNIWIRRYRQEFRKPCMRDQRDTFIF
ncbi:hypothetical protein ILUMI_11698 [Ignelater luminosus]|uniref:Fe2OG dioxygenase domain-containing protein n=1 Tax=Ignelater luminosus TaxID=2038154 RepID=A0A8K0D104_IGNLU|nr:hypothetical protein ILUMI_11698 [Ignelater luminosus]